MCYAIASGGIAAGPFFGDFPPTIGLFSAYPLAGRTCMLRAGGDILKLRFGSCEPAAMIPLPWGIVGAG